jgi:hypothetical protein
MKLPLHGSPNTVYAGKTSVPLTKISVSVPIRGDGSGRSVVTSEVDPTGKVEFSFPEISGRFRLGVSVNDVTPPVAPLAEEAGAVPEASVLSILLMDVVGLIWK